MLNLKGESVLQRKKASKKKNLNKAKLNLSQKKTQWTHIQKEKKKWRR